MATVEQRRAARTDTHNGVGEHRSRGHPRRESRHRRDRRDGPRPRRRAAVAEMAARARAAQPGWEALGFEGRARRAAARAEVADGQRRAGDRHDRLRDRQDLRGRLARRDLLRRQRVRLLGQAGARVPRRRARQVGPAAGQGQEADPALPPARADRRDRPLELPADELLRRLHPRAGRGQQRDPQALRGHAADLAADGRRRCASAACPSDVLQIATGRGQTGAALIEQVDMIMFTGSTAHRAQGRRSRRRGG